MNQSSQRYQVVDRQTGNCVSTHATRRSAIRKVDRLDLAYGACRYHIVSPVDTADRDTLDRWLVDTPAAELQ